METNPSLPSPISLKELILTPLEYKALKVKEHYGQLKQEDFDRLLTLDFQEELRNNPPIEGTFSPEDELAKIRKMPHEQKGQALVSFKENLSRQREALGTLRVFIERSIEFNHDVPREKLIGWLYEFGWKYGFDYRQRKISEKLIDGYYQNRRKVLEIRQKFPDNYDLVKELTGITIGKDEKLDISVGPMTIDIGTTALSAGRIYEKSEKPVTNFQYGGFASRSDGKNPIYYIVINDDASMRALYGDPKGNLTRMHEYEHQKNNLLERVFDRQEAQRTLKEYFKEQDPEIKKTILEEFFRMSRTAALEKAKNEIIACLIYMPLIEFRRYQLKRIFFSQKNDPYDYLAYLRNSKEFKDDLLYQETAQRMLVGEYREIIEKAVNSYSELVSKGSYSIQEGVALLTDRPLGDWSKTIRRLLEQK